MSENQLVSIIMPAYKAEKFIHIGIESVLNQTYQQWELLIVNDCSPDNTAAVVDKYCQMDKRIKLLHNENNSGPAAARNNAINNAVGRFISFLDSDDAWHPDKLQKQIKVMIEKKLPFTYTGYHRVSEDGQTMGRKIEVPSRIGYRKLLRNTAVLTSSVVLDREIVGYIQMRNTYYDDFVCWLEILKRGFFAYGINEDLVEYRVISSSVSRNKLNSAVQVWDTYRSVENLSFLSAMGYFLGYSFNAFIKYMRF